ncbi:MAG TPA: hypothetical protein PLB38_03630 [bacterium]|nr:hypothetical protein [bacterium]
MKIIKPSDEHLSGKLPSFIMTPGDPSSLLKKSPEKIIKETEETIRLNKKEMEILLKIDENNYQRKDLKEFLKRKNIPFDNGFIKIKIDGQAECLMNTSKEDFGTITHIRPPKGFFLKPTHRQKF